MRSRWYGRSTLAASAASAASAAALTMTATKAGVASASGSDPPSFLDAGRPIVAGMPHRAGGGGGGARTLEDAAGNSYSYLDDLTGYALAYGKCVRVKIPQENDDDGNAYFYNGRYHAPSAAYASFYLCSRNGGGDDQCGACDYSTQYVTELEDFLDRQVEYAQSYCGSCAAQCRRRRRAEDEDEDEGGEGGGGDENNAAVDCDRCVDECSLLLAGNEGNDETYYLECQESHQDENGVQYYAGPACDSDTGGLAVGLYYDDECTIKSQPYDNGFAFNTFGTIESMCVDCSYGDYCGDMYGDSYHCVDGYDQRGDDDDMPVCKTFKKATKEWTYATAKGKNKFVPVLITVLVLGALGSVFAFLSYTYYVRHKRAEEALQVPLEGEGEDAVAVAAARDDALIT